MTVKKDTQKYLACTEYLPPLACFPNTIPLVHGTGLRMTLMLEGLLYGWENNKVERCAQGLGGGTDRARGNAEKSPLQEPGENICITRLARLFLG